MAVDWNDLRYLLAVDRRGSLARAAAELGVTKATVSRRIDALEEALGTTLVERGASGWTLAEAGRRVVRTATEVEAACLAMERDLARADERVEGVVRLTAPPWIAERLVIPAMPRLLARHRALDLRVLGSHELLDLVGRAADLALRNVIPTHGPLVVRRVGELAGCVYGSPLYLEHRGHPRDRAALSEHDLVGYEGMGGMPGFEWMREPPFAARVVFRASDPVGLASAIAAGLGLGAIPCLLGETMPNLVRVESLGVGFSPLYLVTHEDLVETARARAVARFLVEVLRANEGVLMGHGDADPSARA
ncbi:MAG: LysR family transcriptional regulator [Nannocystaceae bacterium]|nr:LysR family transcriptional regulator [Nannocystaceae bacterium]